MKIKSFMTMMVAAVAIVLGVSSCGGDDEEDETSYDFGAQVAGSYTGEEDLTVSTSESKDTVTFEFARTSASTIDMTIPASGSGMMAYPAIPVKNITLENIGSSITGKLDSYEGTVTNASGAEKAYKISNLTAVFSDKTLVLTYTMKYGAMPFDMTVVFNGTKK